MLNLKVPPISNRIFTVIFKPWSYDAKWPHASKTTLFHGPQQFTELNCSHNNCIDWYWSQWIFLTLPPPPTHPHPFLWTSKYYSEWPVVSKAKVLLHTQYLWSIREWTGYSSSTEVNYFWMQPAKNLGRWQRIDHQLFHNNSNCSMSRTTQQQTSLKAANYKNENKPISEKCEIKIWNKKKIKHTQTW